MDDCPFCAIASGRADTDLVAARTGEALVVPALKQRHRNRGHMLVLPATHCVRLSEASPGLLQDIYSLAGRVSLAARRAFGASGTTIFQNDDSPDQVLLHLHVHVVPRTVGDGFRMPDPEGELVEREARLRQALALRSALG